MTRAGMHGLALACALGASSCADNSILELELELPAQPAGARYQVQVQARSAPVVDFVEAWAGTEPVSGLELEAAPSMQGVSVVAGGSLTDQVGVRVRFCREAACTGLGDDRAPEAQFLIERAFYRGQRTRVVLEIPEVPTGAPSPTTIPRCDVRGCVAGTTTTFCSFDGRHFCDP